MKIIYVLIFAFCLNFSTGAMAEDMNQLREAVKDICLSPVNAGRLTRTNVGGDIHGRGVLRVVIDGHASADFSSEEWTGVQRVLPQHQEMENAEYRKCVLTLTPLFLQKFSSPNKAPENQQQMTSTLRVSPPPPIIGRVAIQARPSSRYSYSMDGSEVTDKQTGLVWQTCSVGQNFDGKTCLGKAKEFTYEEAMAIADRQWRLPTVRELLSIVHCSSKKVDIAKAINIADGGSPISSGCLGSYARPTIDTQAFPATPAPDSGHGFWSSNLYYSPSGGTWQNFAWVVSFGTGNIYPSFFSPAFVRLVR